MKTIDIFPWNEHFKTGVQLIDTQHYQLVILLNRLATQVAYQSSAEELSKIFDELVEYTVYHFESEDKIWDKYFKDDPLVDEHHKTHQKFIDTVKLLKENQHIKPLNELADEALDFLAKWLASHILETDRYMAYVVLGLESGLDMQSAKKEAEIKISGASRVLVEIILSIYSTLSSNTLQLMKELQTHQRYEKKITYLDKYLELLLELSSSFIDLPLNQIDSQVNKTLQEMARFVDADRAYIFEYNFDEGCTDNTYEWCVNSIEPQIRELQNIPIRLIPDWIKKHLEGEYVLIENVERLPEGDLKNILLPQSIKSLVTFPIFKNGICSGFVGFDAVNKIHTFSDTEIGLLSFFSKTLSSIANRQQTETELIYERSFFKTLIQEIPDLIWLKDIDGVYLACNSRFEDFFGAKETDIIGKTDYDFVEKSLADFFREHDKRALLAEKPNVNEEEISFANDGHKEILQTTKLPMHDSDGNLIGILGVGRNITDIKKIQSRLEEKEYYQRALLDNFPFLIWLKDDESRFLAVNQVFADACNVESPDELVGKTDLDVWPKALAEAYRFDDKDVLLSGKSKNIEEVISSSSTKIWAETYKSPVLIKEHTVGTVGFSRNITAKKEAETKLHLAASVFTHSREGIIITSVQNEIIEVNQAVETMTGYTRDELISRDPKVLSSGLQTPLFYQAMWKELYKSGSWSGEISNRKKNGDIFTEMLTISAVKDSKGDLIHYVGLFTDITVLKDQQKHLEYIAHYDALTGLPNRVLLSDRLQQAMALTHRNESTIAVVYLDIDGFKVINDTYGHDVGDKLLTVVATRMKKTLREGDTIARLGGDEFVAVLHNLKTHEECIPMLKRLLKAASEIIEIEEQKMEVSASLGVSFFESMDTIDADQLLRFADQAMYQAKIAGKNRFHIFDAIHDASIRTQHENLEMVEKALTNNEFILYYQPKVNMYTGEVVGLEALIRWNHKTKGILSPGNFLPIVEGHSLSIKLGEWVIRNVFEQITLWKEKDSKLPVSINIDAMHLLDGNIVEYIKDLFKDYPTVRPHDIILEILETSALEDMLQVTSIMQECKELGIDFSLDDFGTGYSSLTYLKRLPASELKLDQSFVRDMLHDSEDLAILEGVISLAIAFRRNIVAEGVESLKQGEVLLQLGCQIAQGYYIARPMPAKDVVEWVDTWEPELKWKDVESLNREDVSILYVTVEHITWVSKVISFLKDESFEPAEQNERECRFGQWLQGREVKYFEDRPQFTTLKKLHTEIHTKSKKCISMKLKGLLIREKEIENIKQLSQELVSILEAFQA